MTTPKEKRVTLAHWHAAFPSYTPWKNHFLLRQTGPIISGICLDRANDPKKYFPSFFLHNLLIPFPVLSLAYNARLRARGCHQQLNYNGTPDDAIANFKTQMPIAQKELNFEQFFQHLDDDRNHVFSNAGTYLPYVFADLISVGCYLGDADFYQGLLDTACESIKTTKTINLEHLIGGVTTWRTDLEKILRANSGARIKEEQQALKLPELNAQQMLYSRPSSVLERITKW